MEMEDANLIAERKKKWIQNSANMYEIIDAYPMEIV